MKTPSKKSLEEELNGLLQNWKESLEQKQVGAGRRNESLFFNCLSSLPLDYTTMAFNLELDPEDGRAEVYVEQLTGLWGLLPLNEHGPEYHVELLIPRKPFTGDIYATHGSQLRERYFVFGEIATLERDFDYDDHAGRANTILSITPAKIGFLSVANDFGVYRVFPRQISDIKLETDLPKYLKPEQRSFVREFYKNQASLIAKQPAAISEEQAQ